MALVVRRDLVAELLRGPAALAIAGVLTNGFNLIMNLVLARALDPAGYGAFGVQTNIFMILSVVGTAVLTATVHRESAQIGDTRRERRAWIRQLRNVTWVAILVASLLSLALCKPIAVVLSYPHPFAIAEAAVAAAIWVALCVERGLLQARGNYPALARNLVFESGFRITCVVVLVSAGLGVNGAGLALALGCLAGGEHARHAVARTPSLIRRALGTRLSERTEGVTPTATGPIPIVPVAASPRRTRDSLIAESSVALATLVPLALLQNMDVVIVGWRNPSGVGGYAAISTACKVPVFIGLAVANFLLPEAARRRREGLPAGRALAMALVFVVTPGLFLAAVGAVAGRQMLSLVFGPDLAVAAPSLWVLAIAMTCLAATLMFATYLLGAGYRKIVWALTCCTPLTAVVLTLAGGMVMRTALAGLACQAFTATVAGALVYRLHSHHLAPATAAHHVGTDGVGRGAEAAPVEAASADAASTEAGSRSASVTGTTDVPGLTGANEPFDASAAQTRHNLTGHERPSPSVTAN
ncbi:MULTISPECIES: oligosaccharide flippase family protein [unclassified Pseudofrankia]|uniref:oligosaccharide flippase family protein n=1 Tax=unclassified Pseudofrankia TaxID=2994372 RepID=UPI000B0D1965|nr:MULTISPECIES: oligosaccharide flippase family protein [unclassified Pseudofrankia]MDT3440491.1 oligosaccharide flippase family protein [Pseudofrankia sp. BMG5.37]